MFHNISARQSPFTDGIHVSISPCKLESTLRYLTAHYTPVRLEDVINTCNGMRLPPRPLLLTFDDAYASVAEIAAPLCWKYHLPAVFFVNAAFIDNHKLAPDNLICYVANIIGMRALNVAARSVSGNGMPELHSISEVFKKYLPTISLTDREIFLDSLVRISGVDGRDVAENAKLYITKKQLSCLGAYGFEIGNHTYTHTYCRSYTAQQIVSEVDRNKRVLEDYSGAKIRSFSLPYGSAKDLTVKLKNHLKCTGHQAIFLSESVANAPVINQYHLDRVSLCAESDGTLLMEIEILPHVRAIRNKIYSKLNNLTRRCSSLANILSITNHRIKR